MQLGKREQQHRMRRLQLEHGVEHLPTRGLIALASRLGQLFLQCHQSLVSQHVPGNRLPLLQRVPKAQQVTTQPDDLVFARPLVEQGRHRHLWQERHQQFTARDRMTNRLVAVANAVEQRSEDSIRALRVKGTRTNRQRFAERELHTWIRGVSRLQQPQRRQQSIGVTAGAMLRNAIEQPGRNVVLDDHHAASAGLDRREHELGDLALRGVAKRVEHFPQRRGGHLAGIFGCFVAEHDFDRTTRRRDLAFEQRLRA